MNTNCQNCMQDSRLETSMNWFFLPVTGIALFSIFLGTLFIWLMEPRLKDLSELLWYGVLSTWIFFILWNIISFTFFFYSEKSSIFTLWAWKVLTAFFLLSLILAKFFHVSSEKMQHGAIRFSNHSFEKKNISLLPEEVLILTPHCIQKDTCGLKVTIDAQNCKRCGQCNVGELADIAKETGVNLAIVPGGTLARKRVKEYRPKAILAIACERDLTSGIQDVFPIPVFGVLNMRPFGPCVNTEVDMKMVRKAIDQIIKKEN